jgi:hypothetical protein
VTVDKGRYRHDLGELHRVDEPPEARERAVTDIPDVHDR